MEKAIFTTEMGNKFIVQFNPTDIQLSAKASWQEQEAQADVSLLEFKKVDPRTLSMNLIFDTTTNNADVRTSYVNHLMSVFLLKELPDQNPSHNQQGQGTMGPKKRNQLVRFDWSSFSFFGALTSLDVKYTMFAENGQPVRAEVKLSMTEYTTQASYQVGGSRHNITVPQVKLVQMQAGQTLSAMANALGTTAGALAAANGIADPLSVAAGTFLGFNR